MRSTLLGSCVLALSFALVGCDDGMKKDGAGAPPVNGPAGTSPDAAPKGGAMEPAPKGGAMEAAPTTPAPAPTEPKVDPK